MKKLEETRKFLKELKSNKAIIFNFERISDFERELFLSIHGVLSEKYNYHLDGLTNIHFIKFKKYLKDRNILLDSDINRLVTLGLSLYAMISERNLTLGYSFSESKKKIENANLVNFIETIEKYINVYENITSK